MDKLLPQFLKYLRREKNRTAQTVAHYDFYLRRFLYWAKINDPKKIDIKLLKNYQLWLARQTDRAGQPLKKSTQNCHLIALRQFLKYLSRQNINASNFAAINLARAKRPAPYLLQSHELNNLLSAPLKTREAKIIQLRDRTILEILLSTGLKVSQLAGLKKENVDWEKEELKFGSEVKKISHQAAYYLRQYLASRKEPSFNLFIRHDKAMGNKSPKNLTPRSLQRLIKNYSRLAGIKAKITPEVIRQSVIKSR